MANPILSLIISSKNFAGKFSYFQDGSNRNPAHSDPYVADLDGDGIDEVIFGGFETQPNTPSEFSFFTVHIFGWKNGIFQDISNQWLPKNAGDIKGNGDVAIADFNGDGLTDIFLTAYADMLMQFTPFVLYNRGGWFEKIALPSIEAWQHGCGHGDINGDGYIDIFATGYGSSPSVYLGGPNGLKTIPFTNYAGGSDVVFGDFLGDGTLTAVISDYWPKGADTMLGRVIISKDGNSCQFVELGLLPAPLLENLISDAEESHDIRIQAIDFNNDKLLDVIVTSRPNDPSWPIGSAVQFLQNLGKGIFKDVTSSTLQGWVSYSGSDYASVVRDFNKDGLLDIYIDGATWGVTHNSATFLIQDSSGKYTDTYRSQLSNQIADNGGLSTVSMGPGGDFFLVSLDKINGVGNVYTQKLTFKIDTIAPSIALNAGKNIVSIGERVTVTFTLSESSVNFIASDVSVNGGTLSNFAGSGTTYTALFTPTASTTTNGVISVASGVFTDDAGNANEDGLDANNSLILAIDTVAPSISLSTNKTNLFSGATCTLTFTLSESSITFAASDVTVSGGTLSNFAGSGTSYTALFTPTPNNTTNATVSVASGVFTDSAGNTNTDGSDANNLLTLAVDTVVPTIALSSTKNSLIVGDTTTLAFTLSEASTTFIAADVNVAGGKLSNFTGSGASYTALFTPTENSTTNGTVSVASSVFTDIAGNVNADGLDANNTITLAVDTVAPTIALSSSKNSLIAGDTTSLNFTLSEASTTFTASDVNVSGGVLSNFTGSGASYTALFTPTANSATNGTISVASGVFTDTAGNVNADGSDANNYVTMTVNTVPADTTAPTIAIATSATSLSALQTAAITFTLSEASSNFVATDVSVSGGTLSNFSGSGSTYTALYTPTTNSTANGVVSIASGVFTDAAGNSNADGSDTNNIITLTVDTVVPTIALSSTKSTLIAGDTTTLTFILSEASTTFTTSDVRVNGGTLSNFAGSGASYSALFTPTANSTTNGTISVASGIFTDTAGNANADGSDTNNLVTIAIDTLLPTIAVLSNKSSMQGGDAATLTFTLSEVSNNFVAADITVTGGTLSNFAGSGNSYTAIFTLVSSSALNGTINVANGAFTDAAGNTNTDGSDSNNSLNFTRLPTVTNEIHTLSVIVDKNVLGASATLLKELKESITLTNGVITKHLVEYAGLTFEYSQIDSLITTVTRDGEFTAEFTKEINDYLGAEQNITYSAAVAIVGVASIDGIILSVAGADGNYVG